MNELFKQNKLPGFSTERKVTESFILLDDEQDVKLYNNFFYFINDTNVESSFRWHISLSMDLTSVSIGVSWYILHMFQIII